MGEIHELFVLALSLVWFAGATPELRWAKIAIRQSLVFSERGQLSQAIPQVHAERMLNE